MVEILVIASILYHWKFLARIQNFDSVDWPKEFPCANTLFNSLGFTLLFFNC